MESSYYFVPGYTGFCPELLHRIGKSYGHATRKIMREIPHLKSRLSPTRWHGDKRKKKNKPCQMGYDDVIEVENDTPCECPYPSMPDFVEGYSGYIPKNVCMCMGERNKDSERSRPPQRMPSSCGDVCPCYEQDVYQPECFSCDRSGDRKPEGSGCGYWAPHPKGVVHFPVPGTRRPKQEAPAKSCCGSCAEGGTCEGDEVSKSRGKQAPYRSRFPRVMPHRQGGVIVNYTGHIPGMIFSHGETYGNTSRRLLDVHFDNMTKLRMKDRNDYK